MNSAIALNFIPFRASERKVFRKRKRLPGHQWIERNIHVPIGSRQGLYRNANNPAMYGIMDWATRHHVRVIVLGKGIQVGGTLVFYSLLLREGEYTSDNALIVMADERTLKKLIKKRLQKMIDQSPTLSAIKSNKPDDTTQYSITLAHGFTIDGAWASSEVSVSSESYRVVILDEISKYKTRGNIEDAKARATVFGETSKLWILSSPGLDSDDPKNRDPLTKEAEACDAMMEYRAICPECHGEQVMTFDRFKWPGQATLSGDIDANAKAIRRNRSAWYECEHCSARWNDYHRDKAVLAAMQTGWRPTDDDEVEFPRSLYFHYPSWLSPYVSLSDVVADWLEAQGDEEKLRKWHNRHGGVSYIYKPKSARKKDGILALMDDRPEGLVPSMPIAAITAVADMQKKGFYYSIRAWGFGLEAESWLLKCGFVDSWTALEHVFFRSEFHDVAGNAYMPNLWAMDSGGGESEDGELSRTAEAYLFGCRNPQVILFKGNSRMASIHKREVLDKLPGTNKPLPGTCTLYNISSNRYKNDLAAKLMINPSDPGAWHIYNGLTSEDIAVGLGRAQGAERMRSFAQQMCAEVMVDGKWQNPGNKANHFWDVSYYEMALTHIAGVKFWQVQEAIQPNESKQSKSEKARKW
jgi:phage terminase large subunit GpA-like protein